METTNNMKPLRKIVHVGVDCFFAAVMTRNNPSLQGNPVVVCHDDPTKRDLICSANYEARKLGIHAGMKSFRAKQIYPKVVILLSEMNVYYKESRRIRAIFRRFTGIMEPLSLDEAFLDVTGTDKFKGDAGLIASEIRKLIHQEINLTSSAGIASNKFLAKVASDWKKPNGQFSITPHMADVFILKLPVNKIWGIGEETIDKMASLELNTCGALQKLSLNELDSNFGNIGRHLYDICRGIDNRPVVASKKPKLLSIEEMYRTDLQIVDKSKEAKKPPDVKDPSLEISTSIENDKETQELSKIHESISEQFKNAAIFFIQFKDKNYQSTLAKIEPGKDILFVVSKPDTYLSMNASEGDQVILRILGKNGTLRAFESKLIKKKVPQLLVKFPIKENEKFIRADTRTPIHINATFVRLKPKKVKGSGTIINISSRGCAFTTDTELQVDDEIELLIPVSAENVDNEFRIRGTIRSTRTVKSKDEITQYGIQCVDENRKILAEIMKLWKVKKREMNIKQPNNSL